MPEIHQALPKYLQIANHVRDRILRGDLSPGDEVPSERALATEWNVARPTATKALDALRRQGLVGSRQGSGTYVLDQAPPHRRARERYGRARETGALYPPGEFATIMVADLAAAPEHVRLALRLPDGAQAVRRHRITYRDDAPVEASTSWFEPGLAAAAPRLLERERILEGTLAYVEAVVGRPGRTAVDRISARLATAAERAELQLGNDPAAVLVVRHTVHDAAGEPLEHDEAVYPPDRWTFEQEYPLSR